MQSTVIDFRAIIGARVNNFSVIYCYLSIHPKTWWLKVTIILFFHDSAVWAWFGQVVLLLVSLEFFHEAVVVWRLNWDRRIQEDFTHKYRTSVSSSWFLFSHCIIIQWPNPRIIIAWLKIQRSYLYADSLLLGNVYTQC